MAKKNPVKEQRQERYEQDPENQLKTPREFEGDFLSFYMNEPFFGWCSAELTKVADPKCKTAYIGVRKNGNVNEVILGYSPKFFRGLTAIQRRGVIMHEIYHMLFRHIFERMVSDPKDQKLHNWATDLAINSLIGADRLPDIVLMPGKHPIDPETGKPTEGPYAAYIANAEKGLASDVYFDDLKRIRQEEQEKNGEGGDGVTVGFDGGGMDTLDDHDGWGEIDPEAIEELRDKFGGIIERAMQRAMRDNSWGSMPSEIAEALRKLYSKEVDWASIIHNFVGRSRSLQRHSTIKRINKKMPYIHPGVKRPLIANFACFIDQSGSMSDEDIALLFGELQNLASLTQLDVYHFDTEIDTKSHMVWRKGDANPKCLRTRCGGTDFNAVADFLNKPENRGRWSGAIICTDGYAPVMGAVNGAKVLWVITENGTMESVRAGDLACKMKSKDKGKFRGI